MKTIWIFTFAVAFGFFVPLAQAAPASAAPTEAARIDVSPQAAAGNYRDNAWQPETDSGDGGHAPDGGMHHEGPPHSGPVWKPTVNDQVPTRDDSTGPVVYSDVDSTPIYDNDVDGVTKFSVDADYTPAHYTMDDLANAMQDLDSSY